MPGASSTCWHRLEKRLKTGTREAERIEGKREGGREVSKARLTVPGS